MVKNAGLPTVPIRRAIDDPSLLALVSEQYPEVRSFAGRYAHEGMVLHRLDTDTCGLVLIARDRHWYDHLREAQTRGLFVKEYRALVSDTIQREGFPPAEVKLNTMDEMIISSRFRRYGQRGAAVRPVTERSPEHIQLKATTVQYDTAVQPMGMNRYGMQLVRCFLVRGFQHQVRCHLAWIGLAITGDRVYGGTDDGTLHLAATSLQFPDMYTHHPYHIRWETLPDWAMSTTP